MKNTAEIRAENRRRVYRIMLDGTSYTKNQVAALPPDDTGRIYAGDPDQRRF